MFYSAEQETRIHAELEILRSGKATDASLCRYRNVSCVRCCLPHIGGDSHKADSGGYLGPGSLVMRFRNFNPLQDPKIAASQYEDSFPDAGREQMERRFSQRRGLFLKTYDPKRPGQSLPQYMKAAQGNEGYRYQPEACAGPISLYLGGLVSKRLQKGELPECQLLGFVDDKRSAGCMAHPLAETSQGHDGRDQVGFFHHTGCCRNIGCEASKEFRFLSTSALKIFDKAIDGMSWYEYSRHATSVLVYYLRSYGHLLERLDEGDLLDAPALEPLVEFTNALYDEWPLRKPDLLQNPRHHMSPLEILSTGMPLAERILYISLGTCFSNDRFARQLEQAREHVEKRIAAFRSLRI